MRGLLVAWMLGVLVAACGGGTPPEEEVTASWTSGDDAPLEGSEEEGEEDED